MTYKFDCVFYKQFYQDLTHMSEHELSSHYIDYGEKEGRYGSIEELLEQTNNEDFDINFYRTFYSDLQTMTDIQLLQHYLYNGKSEGRYCCKQKMLDHLELVKIKTEFYELYPDFNIDFYKVFNNLEFTSEINILKHFHEIGFKQGMISSESDFFKMYPSFESTFYSLFNQLSFKDRIGVLKNYHRESGKKNFFIISQEDFDLKFIRSLYSDLKDMSDIELLLYYINKGKSQGRFMSKKMMLETNNCTDLEEKINADFYTKYYSLEHLTYNELLYNYIYSGKQEDRLLCEDDFYKIYPEFDLCFYKDFNIELNNKSNNELFAHYKHCGSKSNYEYFNYDFIVNSDYTTSKLDDKTRDLIHNHYYFRYIHTYEQLVEHLKTFEKKYFIYNKESFFKYYNDFNYEYYKNRYFYNSNLTEKEILLYYHLKGKYEHQQINGKIKLVLYIPPYQISCGGIIVVHYFAKLINEKYNDKFYAKLFMHNNIKYKNPFCNDFARLDEINDNTIVIYPEIITGNPLNAKHVVRWILLELGIEMPIDHYKTWNSTDLIYHWETNDKQLCCPFFNNTFKNNNSSNRKKTCYLLKKGPLIHKNISYIHNEDSICIDGLTLPEISKIFNESKFFYTYDPNSAYVSYAAVCGCIPIIYEVEGISEDEYFKSKMYNFKNKIYNKGIVYGNNVNKINYILKNKLNENNEEYYKNFFNLFAENTIPKFLEDIKENFSN
jgi:hypothetical protein